MGKQSAAFTEVIDNEAMFINSNIIEALSHGSYEQKIASMASMVHENRSKFLANPTDDKAVSLIATFENNVIIATDEGRMLKVEVLLNESDGSRQFGKVEEIEIPRLSKTHLKDFVGVKISEAIEHFVDKGHLDINMMSDISGVYGIIRGHNCG